MTTMASQITSLTFVYPTVYSDADQRIKSKFRVTGLCVGNSPGPVFPFDDVIMAIWNRYSWKTWTSLSCIISSMAADSVAMEHFGTLGIKLLPMFSRNIPSHARYRQTFITGNWHFWWWEELSGTNCSNKQGKFTPCVFRVDSEDIVPSVEL